LSSLKATLEEKRENGFPAGKLPFLRSFVAVNRKNAFKLNFMLDNSLKLHLLIKFSVKQQRKHVKHYFEKA